MVFMKSRKNQEKLLHEMLEKTKLNSHIKSTVRERRQVVSTEDYFQIEFQKKLLRYQANQSCHKPCSTLPPVQNLNSNINRKKKILKSQEAKKHNFPSTTSSIIAGNYSKRPIYFCHPITFITTNSKDSLSDEDGAKSKFVEKDLIESLSISYKKQFENDIYGGQNSEKVQKTEENYKISFPQKFRQFCKQEGVNFSCRVFEKALKSFNKKRFSKISKKPSLGDIPENEVITLPNKFQHHSLSPQPTGYQSVKRLSKQTIRDNARRSADQGKNASTRALSFITNNDSQQSKSKRVTLPPLERSALRSFTVTWNPDVSVPISKIT